MSDKEKDIVIWVLAIALACMLCYELIIK